MPVDGSAPAAMRLAMPAGTRLFTLSASAQRAAAHLEDKEIHQFVGPVAGPWAEVAPTSPDYFIGDAQVDGENVFTTEIREDLDDARVVLQEGSGAPHELLHGTTTAAFAGDAMAYVPDRDDTEVVVRNWRTGTTRTFDLGEEVTSVDVRADGAAVAGVGLGRVVLISGAGAVTPITRLGGAPRFAGDRIVYATLDGLRIVDPGGRPRRFGVPTATPVTFDADERHVLWTANGCLLVADVTAPATSAPDPGGCARSEVEMVTTASKLGRDRRVHAHFRCVAAPQRCRGTLHMAMPAGHWRSRTIRFDIPAGDRVALTARVTSTAYRAARRAHERYLVRGVARVHVVGETLDPDGRRTPFSEVFLADTK